jgi:hypothetical protein
VLAVRGGGNGLSLLLNESFASTSMVTGVPAWVVALSLTASATGGTAISSVAVRSPLVRRR